MSDINLGHADIRCGQCGSAEMRYPEELNGDSEVHCNKCGAFVGNVAGILEETARVARKNLGLS